MAAPRPHAARPPATPAAFTRRTHRRSLNEDMAADLWVTWQAVILQLSFVGKYRPLIVYHGDGQVFSHLKVSARLQPIVQSTRLHITVWARGDLTK